MGSALFDKNTNVGHYESVIYLLQALNGLVSILIRKSESIWLQRRYALIDFISVHKKKFYPKNKHYAISCMISINNFVLILQDGPSINEIVIKSLLLEIYQYK